MRLCAAASPKYSSGDRRLVAIEIDGNPTIDHDVGYLLAGYHKLIECSG